MQIYYQFLYLNKNELEFNYPNKMIPENNRSVYRLDRIGNNSFQWNYTGSTSTVRFSSQLQFNSSPRPERFPIIVTPYSSHKWSIPLKFYEWHLHSDIYRIFVGDTYKGAVYLHVSRWLFLPGSHKRSGQFAKCPLVRLDHYNRKPIHGASAMYDLQSIV